MPRAEPPAPGARDGDELRIAAAVAMARRFVDDAAAADRSGGRSARSRQARLRTLVRDADAAEFTVQLTDEVTRIGSPRAAASRFATLVGGADLGALGRLDRALLSLGARLAPVLPHVVMPLVQRRLRAEATGVILPATDPGLGRHLASRAGAGIRCNVNVLGEAIVGDGEAVRRLDMVLAQLRRPDVDYVSVKISAVAPNISPLAFGDTVARVVERLTPLYALAASFEPSKFVNLDMEEYRDLDLTIAAFRELLDRPEFAPLDAGIVLQAYLPDAQESAIELGDWAAERRRRGGGRTKVRVVKGANLAMETVEAELHGWPVATLPSKADVDANYKAVLDILCRPGFDDAIRVGVASHNLFDVAWALGLRSEMVAEGRPERLEFEMLEGMAPSQLDAVHRATGDMLVYAPIVHDDDFPAAIAYLVRRLDENTSPDNFLSHVFDLADDPARFDAEAERFAASVRKRTTVDARTRRRQDRNDPTAADDLDDAFVNAVDTDWTRAANRAWIAGHLAGDVEATTAAPVTLDDVERSVSVAVDAQPGWSGRPARERAEIINRFGDLAEAERGRILAVMAHEAGKTVAQGDPEVSEGIDFARYYARDAVRLAEIDGATPSALGTIVVSPPWNFPFAIPAGGVLASLAAGSTVILKPAPQSVRTAGLIAELCWRAGVPDDVLQFVPAADDDAGRRLVTHSDVDAVILTGAHATAAMFQSWRPDLRLHAETSGKNALVITASADRDHAVADLVRSAFGHAGQKCSAASVAIVHASLYDDPAFIERIRDAAATLRVGPADDLATDVGPLIEAPGEMLERALTQLDPGESWLLEPECRTDDRRLWSPGIRLGVRADSWLARTECFGPVLAIVRADDLDHAIEIQNGGDLGLTAGLHALDPVEIDRWIDRVEAGNVYVNRGITGAIVQRQPFGGWKRSVVGPTAKAGGPNYVASLCRWTDRRAQSGPIDVVRGAFRTWWTEIGSQEHDPTDLAAERNGFRYRPSGGVAVRFGPDATSYERALVDAAITTTGCRVVRSEASDEPADQFATRLADLGVERLRLVGGSGDAAHVIRSACHDAGVAVDDNAPVGAPEIELPRWLREQAVTVTMHRHGRVPADRSPGK